MVQCIVLDFYREALTPCSAPQAGLPYLIRTIISDCAYGVPGYATVDFLSAVNEHQGQ